MLRRLLLDCERRLLRETFAAAISTEHDAPFFVSLLHLPTQREYRSRSKQFYAVGPQWHIQPRFDVLCERAPAGA
jgi:hypothetical protein